MNYTPLFAELITNLKSNSRVQIEKEELYEKEVLLEEFLIKFPYLNTIRDEIRMLNDNHLYWLYKDKDGEFIPGGEFRLMAIEEVVAVHQDLWFNPDVNAEKSLQENFKIFEDYPNAGNGVLCGFVFKDIPEIWLYDNGNAFQLELNLHDYFLQLVKLKAIYYWQYFFIKDKKKNYKNSLILSRMTSVLNKLKYLFPDEDYSLFERIIKSD